MCYRYGKWIGSTYCWRVDFQRLTRSQSPVQVPMSAHSSNTAYITLKLFVLSTIRFTGGGPLMSTQIHDGPVAYRYTPFCVSHFTYCIIFYTILVVCYIIFDDFLTVTIYVIAIIIILWLVFLDVDRERCENYLKLFKSCRACGLL